MDAPEGDISFEGKMVRQYDAIAAKIEARVKPQFAAVPEPRNNSEYETMEWKSDDGELGLKHRNDPRFSHEPRTIAQTVLLRPGEVNTPNNTYISLTYRTGEFRPPDERMYDMSGYELLPFVNNAGRVHTDRCLEVGILDRVYFFDQDGNLVKCVGVKDPKGKVKVVPQQVTVQDTYAIEEWNHLNPAQRAAVAAERTWVYEDIEPGDHELIAASLGKLQQVVNSHFPPPEPEA